MVLRQVHLELCKITKLVCTILGVQMAWEIGEIIVILTGSLYYFYIRYITQQYKILLEQTILILAFSSLSILKAVYLSRVCKDAADEVVYLVYHCLILIIDFIIELTHLQANKTIEIIHAIYGCDADTDMQEEVCLLLYC